MKDKDIFDELVETKFKLGLEINELKEEILELKYQLSMEKAENSYIREETSEETIPRYIIQQKVEELDNMNVSGKLFTTAIKFAKSILEDLLKEN